MKRSVLLALQVAGHLAYMVVIPILLFGGIGLMLDRQLGTLPLYLLLGLGVAFVSTFYWLSKRFAQIIREILK